MDGGAQMQLEAAAASQPSRGVLIVDDSLLMQRKLRELVERQQYEVAGIAGSAEQALRLLRSIRPRVVILDHNLPEMSGLEFLKRLRSAISDVRVIVCSGSLTLQAGREFLAAGANELLAKPVQLDIFIQALGRCMA